jgi:hypothetical protein
MAFNKQPIRVGLRQGAFIGCVAAYALVSIPLFPLRAQTGPVARTVFATVLLLVFTMLALRDTSKEPEEATDAPYFLGFVFTMVSLVGGLLDIRESLSDDRWIAGLVLELGYALLLTVLGLVIRQFLALALPDDQADPQGPVAFPGFDHDTWLRQVVQPMASIVAQLSAVTSRGEVGATAAAITNFDAGVRQATQRLATAIGQHADTMQERDEVLRTNMQHLRVFEDRIRGALEELNEKMDTFVRQSKLVFTSLTEVAEQGTKVNRDVLDQTRTTLEERRAELAGMRAATEDEWRQALNALRDSSRDLERVGVTMVQAVDQWPNPVDKLTGLWATLDDKEKQLSEAIDAVTQRLKGVGEAAGTTAGSVRALGASADAGATQMGEGARAVRESLDKEAQAMMRLVDELYAFIIRQLEKEKGR